ncbi:MAG: PGPGW domain-containing protein [Terriglobales bacterium]
MKRAVKKALVLVVGWLFIIVGVIGLFVPVLQGVLFLLIGLAILSSEYVWAHNLLQRLKQRFPKIAEMSHRAHIKAEQWLHRITGRGKPQTDRAE